LRHGQSPGNDARFSTIEQNLNLQCDALKAAGCQKIIEDRASGGEVKRDGLERVFWEAVEKSDSK
jgi:DNA invertase Pin-like site-specific DNA recombinase